MRESDPRAVAGCVAVLAVMAFLVGLVVVAVVLR